MEISLSWIPKYLLSGFRNAVAVIQISDNYKKYFAIPTASSTAYTATASSTAVATANSTIEFYMRALFLG